MQKIYKIIEKVVLFTRSLWLIGRGTKYKHESTQDKFSVLNYESYFIIENIRLRVNAVYCKEIIMKMWFIVDNESEDRTWESWTQMNL